MYRKDEGEKKKSQESKNGLYMVCMPPRCHLGCPICIFNIPHVSKNKEKSTIDFYPSFIIILYCTTAILFVATETHIIPPTIHPLYGLMCLYKLWEASYVHL